MTDVAPETDVEALVATITACLNRRVSSTTDAFAALARLRSLLLRAEEERDEERERFHRHVETMIEPKLLARAEAAEKERDRLQHIIDCADTPLMRDVMRERDACAELLRWQPHTERGLANLHPQHRATVERARALTAEETKEADSTKLELIDPNWMGEAHD